MIDVVFPVLDEAESLPWVLSRVPVGFNAIVVDNGSTDGSPQIARSLGAEVVFQARRGFGAACWRGLTTSTSELVCFMDCDGSLDPRALADIVQPLRTGAADLILGARRADRGAWAPHARLANRCLTFELQRRSGMKLADIGPMRAARRDDLLTLELRDRRSGWPLEMVLRAIQSGWRIVEVPVAYRRRAGRSKVTGTVSGTVTAVLDMARVLR
jgi:glycosyltransferase involved in cell wall biosynthesis